MSGIFITIEGPDGAGKSTVIKKLAQKISENSSVQVLLTREPGGIDISEAIRDIILSPKNIAMDERTEALLYAAARRQHLVQKVEPALKEGKLVLCDRFVDSSLAYQGAGREIGMEAIWSINQFAIEETMPELTLYLDIDAKIGLERINQGRKFEELDRLDQEGLVFHERVRAAYLELLLKYPERIQKVDASKSIETVIDACYNLIKDKFPNLFN
ncbi:dTMP kinase [Vagococcus sp.]|uniref:dTMP kinase n=1 Tax=Vagococcus sp. TaxID=1933889 RepID=UPI003F9CD52C